MDTLPTTDTKLKVPLCTYVRRCFHAEYMETHITCPSYSNRAGPDMISLVMNRDLMMYIYTFRGSSL